MKRILLLSLGIIILGFKNRPLSQQATVLDCSPIEYNPKILSYPHADSIHPDWAEGEVGLSWSISTTKKVKNENGTFLYGDLYSPRGGLITKNCYVISSEWNCSE